MNAPAKLVGVIEWLFGDAAVFNIVSAENLLVERTSSGSDLFIGDTFFTKASFHERMAFLSTAMFCPRGIVRGPLRPALMAQLIHVGARTIIVEGDTYVVWGAAHEVGEDASMPTRAESFHPYTIPLHLVDRILRDYGPEVFIETGTGHRYTLTSMVERFNEIWSVELHPLLARIAKQSFGASRHVNIVEGNSSIELPRILERVGFRRALVWLDAHWSGEGTAQISEETHTAVVGELAALAAAKRNDHIIMIDDIAEFDGTRGFPTEDELRQRLSEINPAYQITVHQSLRRGVLEARPSR